MEKEYRSMSGKKSKFQEQSGVLLTEEIKSEIKKVFKNALSCIEMRFGTEFDGFDIIRANILRAGNDAIREVGRIIDEKYCVEKQKDIFTVKFKDRNNLGKGEGHGRQ